MEQWRHSPNRQMRQFAYYLHITSPPAGEAPEWVREKWVGISIPLAQSSPAPVSLLTQGVLSGPQGFIACLLRWVTGGFVRKAGYIVESRTAIQILEKVQPEAAIWWKDNLPRFMREGQQFLFEQQDGYVDENP